LYVIRLSIEQTEYFNMLSNKRFALINKCHNIMIKHSNHLLNKLKHDKQYQDLLDAYHKAEAGSKEAKAIGRQMNEYRSSIGLSKSWLESYIKIWQKQHSDHISSHQAQKEAQGVMSGVDKIIFSSGKELHFRKLSQTTTLCSKSPTNGVAFDRETMAFRWLKDLFSVKPLDKDNLYMIQALYPNGTESLPISYCEIKRMMFPNGWHYYLNIYVKGTAPQKHVVGIGKAGVDPGTSTMAVSTEHKAILRELAPKTNNYTKRLKHTLKAMDKSRRGSNPDNYDSDGRVIKGCKIWRKSKRYKELERKYQSLCRRKALYIRQSHCILANEVLEQANNIIVEHMDYRGLQHRAKNTERQDKVTVIKNRKGKQQAVRKYKRKKRFGKSLGSRAPAEFLTILKQKLDAVDGQYNEVDTKAFKASQYDHSDNTYTKVTLNTRFKIVGGIEVQRDLYSAFLIQHSNRNLDSPDRQACIMDFKTFVNLQNEEIQYLKASDQSRPECFGF
jgi:hypothetical protein